MPALNRVHWEVRRNRSEDGLYLLWDKWPLLAGQGPWEMVYHSLLFLCV